MAVKIAPSAAWLGAVMVILTYVSVIFEISVLGTAIYMIFAGMLVGVIELPGWCTCFDFCQVLRKKLGPVQHLYAVRGLIYLVLGSVGFVIYKYVNHSAGSGWMMALVMAMYLACGGMYIAATINGEAGQRDPTSLPPPARTPEGAAAPAGSGVGGWFGSSGGASAPAPAPTPAPAPAPASGGGGGGTGAFLGGFFGGNSGTGAGSSSSSGYKPPLADQEVGYADPSSGPMGDDRAGLEAFLADEPAPAPAPAQSYETDYGAESNPFA